MSTDNVDFLVGSKGGQVIGFQNVLISVQTIPVFVLFDLVL